jgi:pimeloyl-ACP methyl ester carboxylesterase
MEKVRIGLAMKLRLQLRKNWRVILAVYAVCLSLSWAIAYRKSVAELRPGYRRHPLQVQAADGPRSGLVEIAYRDTAPDSHLPVVVLIHGSPGTGEVLDRLGDLLQDRFRVIIPDLPGFGGSTRNLPDYSFRAHARYLNALLNDLQIHRAQLVGFSMGGGVILSMYDLAPATVSSLVMLSAIGVQEHELTGNYTVNHLIHGLQLAGLTALIRGTPHFGILDRSMFSLEYARNFYDSDQRPLRGVLERYRGPMLIIHGRKDPLVPESAALEHKRIVGQSELVMLDSDHFMAFMNPGMFLQPLKDFLLRNADERSR